MKYTYILFCLLLGSCDAVDKPKEKIIRVTGEGKIRVKPDKVILTLHISF